MSGLKSAWEISLKKTNQISPELKLKKLSSKQKIEIAEIRKEYEAQIADKEVILDHNIKKLVDRVPPDQLESASEDIKNQFIEDKKNLINEMEKKIQSVRDS